MSTREYAKTIIDRLTDEQVDELFGYIKNRFLPDPPNTAHSQAELEAMLEKGMEDIKQGRTVPWEKAKAEIMEMFDKWRS